jgi:hypothetical protein
MTVPARQAFDSMVRRAMALGIGDRVYACLREIEAELQMRPLEWGEPSSRLRGMGLILSVGFRDRIRVEYGVHESHPVVFIRDFVPQLGHPLYSPSSS